METGRAFGEEVARPRAMESASFTTAVQADAQGIAPCEEPHRGRPERRVAGCSNRVPTFGNERLALSGNIAKAKPTR